MRFTLIGAALTMAALGAVSFAQEYHGPPPPKADTPYLLHAENLYETEHAVAREEDRKKETAYVVDGAASPVRTPLAEPIFIMLADKIEPQSLKLYEMTVEDGHREIAFPKKIGKNTPRAHYITFRRLEDEGVYWVEVNEYLDNGQYCLSPERWQRRLLLRDILNGVYRSRGARLIQSTYVPRTRARRTCDTRPGEARAMVR